jgi:hypothetical protein
MRVEAIERQQLSKCFRERIISPGRLAGMNRSKAFPESSKQSMPRESVKRILPPLILGMRLHEEEVILNRAMKPLFGMSPAMMVIVGAIVSLR